MRAKSGYFESFEIVRRDVIGVVEMSSEGTQDPLAVALGLVAAWLPENLGQEAMAIEFEIWSRKFHVLVDRNEIQNDD